ncbi:MAG TPA: hypothetical protein PKY35_08380 [Candidatus Hydrogenedentes bacterium]|nr:hypothetical protein [Candidatus Hydrogenedentota bacterium]HOL77031.1 hypothetical protein [Candidatus Hydrogenedentota bacterium]HPO85786.1 hypothetical protein [Candidatus Hydrogenedentota bacterium]
MWEIDGGRHEVAHPSLLREGAQDPPPLALPPIVTARNAVRHDAAIPSGIRE